MPTRIQTLEAELRGVQLVLGSMLAHALMASGDAKTQVAGFHEEIEMSCANASLPEIADKDREAYRKRMRTTALATIAMAANVEIFQRTSSQH